MASKPGWCRIGFHYLFDEAEVAYLLDAVEFVADYGYRFLPLYRFDSPTASGLTVSKPNRRSSFTG